MSKYVASLIALTLMMGFECSDVQKKGEDLDVSVVVQYDTLLLLDPVTGKEVIRIVEVQLDDFENKENEK